MFSGVGNFLYRHRRKFIYGGILGGGFLFATKYAEKKFFEWQQRETNILLEKQKRRQHFESTKTTACTTALALTNSLNDIISRELDTDALLQAIRDKPECKQEIWQELKVVVISKTLCNVYTSALMTSAVHVQLMLLGGYCYGDLVKDGHAGVTINSQVQRKYLLGIQDLICDGILDIILTVKKAVSHICGGISLAKPLTLKQLEGVIQEIVLCLKGERDFEQSDFKLLPWSHYLTKNGMPINDKASLADPVDQVLNNMMTETIDVLDGQDFNLIVNNLIQQGLNFVLDKLANYFPIDIKTDGSNLIQSEIPLAKIIPILCHQIHGSLTPLQTELVKILLMDSQLEALSYNVYEGFSVPLSKDL